jgi:hypothetical protein
VNKNKKYIIGISVLCIIFLITYLIHSYNVGAAKIEIENKTNASRNNFLKQKEDRRAKFLKKSPKEELCFDKYFELEKAELTKDTLIHFFVYSDKLTFSLFEVDYFDCLLRLCEIEMKNEKLVTNLEDKLYPIRKRYGKLATKWIDEIGIDQFSIETKEGSYCDKYELGITLSSINDVALSDFQNFLEEYLANEREVKTLSRNNQSDYDNQLNIGKKGLTETGRSILFSELNRSPVFLDKHVSFSYQSESLGAINYYFNSKEFKDSRLNEIFDNIYVEQYKNNSLYTGATPYSYCFGNSNSCSGLSCSQIKVKSGGQDVLVTVKNRSGEVYRHAYIKSGQSFTFEVYDGRYQVFFYGGTGWNPNKFIKKVNCGNLKGGFVASENVSKDDYLDVHGQIMTYELIMQQNGNFSTKSSNLNEAF